MKKIRIDYDFLVFLSAYIRQVDLSLDRARWGNWSEFIDYYKFQITPMNVYDQLRQFSKVQPKATTFVYFPKENYFLKRLHRLLLLLIRRNNYFYEIDIQYAYTLLMAFGKLLNGGFSDYNLEAEKLRMKFAGFYSCVLIYKMRGRDIENTINVEHFFQSDVNKTIKINYFLK